MIRMLLSWSLVPHSPNIMVPRHSWLTPDPGGAEASLLHRHFVSSMVSDSRGFTGDARALQLARKFRACSEALWGSTV